MFDKTNIILLLVKAFVLFTALPFHGYATAWVAVKCGDNTPKDYGKLTINPFVHLDPIGSIAMLFIGFGWTKPVPVNTSNFRNRKLGTILYSIAGPVASLIIAFVMTFLWRCLFALVPVETILSSSMLIYLITIVDAVIQLNVGLALFMLLFMGLSRLSVMIVRLLPSHIQYKFFSNPQSLFMIMLLIFLVTPLSSLVSIMSEYVIGLFNIILFFIR